MYSAKAAVGVTRRLERLLEQINGELLSRLANGGVIAPHEVSTDPLMQQVALWRSQLLSVQKQLHGLQASLAFRQGSARGLPEMQRWAENQSIASHQSRLDRAAQLAREVQQRLAQLVQSLLVPDGVERINKSIDLLEDAATRIDEWIKEAKHQKLLTQADVAELRESIASNPPWVEPAPKAAPGGVDPILALTIVLRLLHMLLLARVDRR